MLALLAAICNHKVKSLPENGAKAQGYVKIWIERYWEIELQDKVSLKPALPLSF